MKKILEIENLTKSYHGIKAVNNLSFDVKEGEILGLLGPNGSGKSTTINSILSLLKYDQGMIKIFGKKMTATSYDMKRKIGVVFQDVAVFNELTVYENIDYFCGLYIKDKKLRKKYVLDAMKLVGLEEFMKYYPKQLSGGLLRRLNIACGVSHKPSLIFLDEPTVAVDPQSRNHILEGIKTLNKMGATIVYTTHYMEEVEKLCNRIIIIDKGEIIAEGSKEELKRLVNIEEKIIVELENKLEDNHRNEISKMRNIRDLSEENNQLLISFSKGKNNLSNLIDYMREHKIKYNRIYSELPTLNDVFLELTGKELRD